MVVILHDYLVFYPCCSNSCTQTSLAFYFICPAGFCDFIHSSRKRSADATIGQHAEIVGKEGPSLRILPLMSSVVLGQMVTVAPVIFVAHYVISLCTSARA